VTDGEPLSLRTITTLATAATLAAINAIIVLPLFKGEYNWNLGSIDCAHVTYAQYAALHPGANWNPQWYCGFPTHLTYPPIFPKLLALLHIIIPTASIPHLYRVTTALLYTLGPATLYILVKYLTHRESSAIIAALFYSLAPSVFYLLVPDMRHVGQQFGYVPWRLIAMTVYGEGPHIGSLTFLPLAALFFLRALRKQTWPAYILAALASALVGLTNLFGGFALAVAALAILFSESLLGQAPRKFIAAFCIAVLTYGLCAFQYDSSFIRALLASSHAHPENALRLPPGTALFFLLMLSFALIPFIATIFGKPDRQALFIGLLWSGLFCTFILTYYVTGLSLAPQPIRYAPEAQMGCAILAGILLTALLDRLSLPSWPSLIRVALLIIFAAGFVTPLVRAGHTVTRPHPDISSTPEYRIAQWLAEHMQEGERAYLTGTPAFWLNVFTAVPQLRGAADNAQPSHWWADISYQINKGSDGELALLWLRALGIRYVVVNYPQSQTPYMDYAFPTKFESLLPMIYECHGFRIFEVSGVSGNLLEAVDLHMARTVRIESVLDRQGLEHLLQLYESKRDVQVEITYEPDHDPDQITVHITGATPDTALLLKMTHDRRWHAYHADTELPIEAIGPDLMLIIPQCEGSFTVRLQCRPLLSERLGLLISGTTVLAMLGATIHSTIHSLARR